MTFKILLICLGVLIGAFLVISFIVALVISARNRRALKAANASNLNIHSKKDFYYTIKEERRSH